MTTPTTPHTNPAGTRLIGGQNLLDKAIAYVAPGIAARRLASRAQLAFAGGYTGARIDRAALNRWQPNAGSPNSDIIRDLPTLRARSRDQMRNAPVAVGAINQVVNNVIGTGLSHSAALDAEFLGLTTEEAEDWAEDVDRRFNAWANSPDCDLSRQVNFYGLQEVFCRSWLESGDCFATTPLIKRGGAQRMLAIQLLEADRISNPNRSANTDTLIDGIELNPQTLEAIAVHISSRHPGDLLGNTNTWQRVAVRGSATDRRNVLHGFKPLRPGQVRGVPWIAPILEPLKQLGRWTDAELNAAVTSSLFSVFVKMDPEAFQEVFDDDAKGMIVEKSSQWSGEMESGKAVNLLPGESIETSSPGRPNPQFDPFWQAMVRQIGMALELPFEVLVMHFQSSYSAARGALLMAWKFFRSRRDLMATQFCQPIYELWLMEEVAQGRIRAPGIFANPLLRAAWCAGVWTGDGPGSIDPSKEVDAAQKRVDLGISTKQAESILHDGIDWRIKHKQRVKEINAEKEDGIYFPPAGSAAPTSMPSSTPSPTTPADPADSGDPGNGPGMDPSEPTDARYTPAHRMGHHQPAPAVSIAVDLTSAAMDRALMAAAQPFFDQFQATASAVLEKDMQVHVHVPQQAAPQIQFAPQINVDPTPITVEANMPAAQVVVNNAFAKTATQVVERDANDEIVRTTTTYSAD